MNILKITAAVLGATLLGATAHAARLVDVTGEFWDGDSTMNTLSLAMDEIRSRDADTLFDVVAIDYPNGSTGSISNSTSLSSFLGDLGTITSGEDFANLTTSVMRFTGHILIEEGDTEWSVGSDDGFQLYIEDSFMGKYDGTRGFKTTSGTLHQAPGLYLFELVYFENTGKTGVEFAVNGDIVSGEVPVPAAGILMAAGLAGLGLRRRK